MSTLKFEEFWKDIIWNPAYDDCCHCSTRKGGSIPATYEMWFEVLGASLGKSAPYCSRQALCVACTASTLEEERDPTVDSSEMRVLLVRLIR